MFSELTTDYWLCAMCQELNLDLMHEKQETYQLWALQLIFKYLIISNSIIHLFFISPFQIDLAYMIETLNFNIRKYALISTSEIHLLDIKTIFTNLLHLPHLLQ